MHSSTTQQIHCRELKQFLFWVLFTVGLTSCWDSPVQSNAIDPLPKQTGRDSWQKPELLIEAIGADSGMVVADIGAGTGYFTFRLAFTVEKVIATEIDPSMVNIIEIFRENLPAEIKNKIETRLVTPTTSGIEPEEADLALIINTIGYIDNPTTYLSDLAKGLKNGGSVAIVDFKKKFLSIEAPPIEERIDPNQLFNQLAEAGYSDIRINDTTLDYQYIITASK